MTDHCYVGFRPRRSGLPGPVEPGAGTSCLVQSLQGEEGHTLAHGRRGYLSLARLAHGAMGSVTLHPDIAAVLAGERQWCVVCGDALELLPMLPGGCVDAVVTDPPYGMDCDNDCTRFTMTPNGHGEVSKRIYPPTIGDDKPFDPSLWLAFPRVVLWGSNHFSERLPVGTTLVWLKKFDTKFGVFLSDAEIGWMKGGHGVYCRRDTSLLGITNERAHPNQKPVGLMEWCFERAKVSVGACILDPFTGSGTTGVACIQTGR